MIETKHIIQFGGETNQLAAKVLSGEKVATGGVSKQAHPHIKLLNLKSKN